MASSVGYSVVYITGQFMLALGFSQALIIVHEAGHRTMFKGRRLNDIVGTCAGFLALVPYASWRPIHARHHRYTGWQDLDATTESLVPRQVSGWERAIVNLAWRTWLPLFSIIYRIQNYWRVDRIRPYIDKKVRQTRLRGAIYIQLMAYILLIAWVGAQESLVMVGPSLLLTLAFQDILLLSQHTHMPTHISRGLDVPLFPPLQQGPFTRSLRLPAWLSWLILHFDAHELHHLYPAVPGYLLHRIPYAPPNEVHWLTWIREVKAMSGHDFLFGGPHPEYKP